MAQTTALPDRRQIYRPFLERLNPASSGGVAPENLLVPPEHDPRDPDQPPIHIAFANTAELSPGAQMALVGGIGSGKTTELRLTLDVLKRHADAVNIYMDLAEMTDLNTMNPGAILTAIGMKLYQKLNKTKRQEAGVKSAYKKLGELARGRTEWVAPEDDVLYEEDDSDQVMVPVEVPGLLRPRFPAIARPVADVREQLFQIAMPFVEESAQITVLIDGLDRLIRPERFREFVEQDLRTLRETSISVIVAAPLLLRFEQDRFLQDYFEEVKHIPAASTDPDESDFLTKVLVKRGASELMAQPEIAEICRFSGGVMRDIITLARTSAEAAYRDDKDRIEAPHVASAIRQLGRRYLIGLGNPQKRLIRRLIQNDEFSVQDPISKQLLVNRQVLEYFTSHKDSFAVHPALEKVLADAA